jgi:hypothetical protein
LQVLPQCVNAPIEIGDRGAIQVSIKTSVQAFSSPLSPTILFDSLPIQFQIDTSADSDSTDSSKIRVAWAAPYVNATFLPVVAEASEEGFYVSATATVKRGSNGGVGLSIEQERRRIATLAQIATPDPACPNTGDLRVEVAGMEIGPNGVVIQALAAAADVIKRVDDELHKIATTPAKAAEDLPGNVAREVHNFFHNLPNPPNLPLPRLPNAPNLPNIPLPRLPDLPLPHL